MELRSRNPSADRARAALDRSRFVSRLLDDAVSVPGTDIRFGLDPVLGVLPVAGDTAASLLSLYVVAEAVRLGAPASTVARMLLAIGVDTVGGSLPLVGVLFDASWKANERNVALLERYVESLAE